MEERPIIKTEENLESQFCGPVRCGNVNEKRNDTTLRISDENFDIFPSKALVCRLWFCTKSALLKVSNYFTIAGSMHTA
jgi:hypothetical protein